MNRKPNFFIFLRWKNKLAKKDWKENRVLGIYCNINQVRISDLMNFKGGCPFCVGARLTWHTGFVQYELSVKAAKLSANTVSTTILTILIMKLILLLVHFSRVCEFEILVLRLNILSRVEFNSEVESEVKLIFKRLFFWGRIFCKFTSLSEVVFQA